MNMGMFRCNMCGAKYEDLKFFILWCPVYGEERKKSARLQLHSTVERPAINII